MTQYTEEKAKNDPLWLKHLQYFQIFHSCRMRERRTTKRSLTTKMTSSELSSNKQFNEKNFSFKSDLISIMH